MRDILITYKDDGTPIRSPEWIGAEQGFIDQFCVFMNRQEAWEVAMTANQVKFDGEYSTGTLYSEDLY
jgi:hypothetical protein